MNTNNTYFLDDLGVTTREAVLFCLRDINYYAVDLQIKNKTLFGEALFTGNTLEVVVYANLIKFGGLLFDLQVHLTKINKQ
mmetsp:Transcript_24800/g.38595  ORF Transcript_24800/g.38595 Transcript_24800/m.38595 type:complete len:81 (-) Transcript_24800:39-281(-)